MVAKAEELKTSSDLIDIAKELIMDLVNKYDLTECEQSIVIFLMQDANQYVLEALHIGRMKKHD